MYITDNIKHFEHSQCIVIMSADHFKDKSVVILQFSCCQQM